MAKTEQSRYEAETTITFNELEPNAVLWTASVAVRNEWRECGYAVEAWYGEWRCEVPPDRIVFKPLKKPSKLEG